MSSFARSLQRRADQSDFAEQIQRGLTALTVIFWAGIIYYATTQAMPRAKLGVGFLGGIASIYIVDEISYSLEEGKLADILLLLVCQLVIIIVTVYILANFQVMNVVRVGYATDLEYVLAAIMFVNIVYLTYREYGRTFLILPLLIVFYGIYGSVVPGPLGHAGLSWERTLQILVIDIEGIYGYLTRVTAAWIALFLLYAGLLEGYGAFDLILKSAIKTVDYVKSGVAQSAVLASMVIGSVNGSQTANTGITGSFTIPLMKRSGLSAETAAATEAVASTGGQVLPPVMGAAAFIMAALLGRPYADIIVAGAVPVVIFYFSVVVAVHYNSVNEIDRDFTKAIIYEQEDLEEQSKERLIAEAFRFGIPFLLLIYLLAIVQITVISAALYTCLAMIATGVLLPILTKMYSTINGDTVTGVFHGAQSGIMQTISGFKSGALSLAPLALIIANINGIVDILLATGVPGALSLTLIELSGGILIVALLMSMAICILLGLGMPTSAAYLIVASLVAPALVSQFNLEQIVAHYFVFYSAILAGLTPPIATAVAVGTGIAGGNFWRTCYQAIKLAAPLFVLPFVFAYNPTFIIPGFNLTVIALVGAVFVGSLSVIHGANYVYAPTENYYINKGFRAFFLVAGVCAMVVPVWRIRGAAIAAIAVFLGVYVYMTKSGSGESLDGVGSDR